MSAAFARASAVTFRVDAYPTETFIGTVSQVRLEPKVQQNVVTYATVIDVPNNELKLKPGMTANVNVEIARSYERAAHAERARCGSGRPAKCTRRSVRRRRTPADRRARRAAIAAARRADEPTRRTGSGSNSRTPPDGRQRPTAPAARARTARRYCDVARRRRRGLTRTERADAAAATDGGVARGGFGGNRRRANARSRARTA